MNYPEEYYYLTPVGQYRMWRFVVWHESMHVKHSVAFFRHDESVTDNVTRYLYNVVEDYKVENLGIKEYPGMKTEREFAYELAFKVAGKPKDELEQFAQLLLFGQVKDEKPRSDVVKAVEYVKDELKKSNFRANTARLVKKVMEMLGIRRNALNYVIEHPTRRLWYGEMNCSGADIEEVEKKYKPAEEVVREYHELVRKSMELNKMKALYEKLDIDEPRSSSDPTSYYDYALVNHLKSKLMLVRRGWAEKESVAGEDFDVEGYMRGRPFNSEVRVGRGGWKAVLLLDHSGSIEPIEKEYKKAVIALAEAMDYAKVKFAVFVFCGYELYKIKDFNEKWSRHHAAKLAGIKAGGMTPTHVIYRKLSSLNIDGSVFITFTDGEPDSVELTKEWVEILKSRCRMVAVAIGTSAEWVVSLAEHLKRFEYNQCVAIDDLRKLPEVILKLILQ